MNVGIVGASGYSGEELVRLLTRHPRAQLLSVTSRTLAGQPVAKALPRLRGVVAPDLLFTPSEPAVLAADTRIDAYFLALPHGVAAEYARPLVAAGKLVIDLSADFRLSLDHNLPGILRPPASGPGFARRCRLRAARDHGRRFLEEKTPPRLPRLLPNQRAGAAGAVVACRSGFISANIVVNSFSGVSGAGKKVDEDYLFCERAESTKAYGIPKHRHLSEIEEQLSTAAGAKIIIQFTPHLAPMKRGIATTIVAKAQAKDVEAVYAVWKKAYAGQPFVQILPPGQTPDTAYVTGTNRIDIAAAFDPRTATSSSLPPRTTSSKARAARPCKS